MATNDAGPPPRPLRPAAAGLLLLLLAGACAWSVPADPGLHAMRRADPPTARSVSSAAEAVRDDPGARALYLSHCGRCPEPWPPTHLRAAEWPRFVRHYAPRAGLYGADRDRVLRWLQANAR
jgi:hypothetical protein